MLIILEAYAGAFKRSFSLSPDSSHCATVASPELRSSEPGQDVYLVYCARDVIRESAQIADSLS